jgi:hypothetical protein
VFCVVGKSVSRYCVIGTIIDVDATLGVNYGVFRKGVVKGSGGSDSKATVSYGVCRYGVKGGFVKFNSIMVVV